MSTITRVVAFFGAFLFTALAHKVYHVPVGLPWWNYMLGGFCFYIAVSCINAAFDD